MDSDSSDLPGWDVCTRCRREPRDEADYETWHTFDEGAVCAGCLTMLEAAASREDD